MGFWDGYGGGASSGSNGGGGSFWEGYQAPTPAPAKPTFGSVAHGFLNSVGHAITHPVETAKAGYDNFVKPVVDTFEQLPSNIEHSVKGIGYGAESMAHAVSGNRPQALADIQKSNAEFDKTYMAKGLKETRDKSVPLEKGIRDVAGETGNQVLNIVTPISGGSVAKGIVTDVAKVGGKAAIKEGLKIGGKFGAAYGGTAALQEDKFSPGNIAKDVGEGVAGGVIAGGVLGGVSHVTGSLLTKALQGWVGKRADAAAAHDPVNKSTLDEAPLGLPAPKSGGNLPARSVMNPVSKTAGPNGGVFGNFNEVSHETALQLHQLNHTIEAFNNQGEHVAPANRTVDTTQMGGGDAKDGLVHLSQLQTLRNQAALTMDSIAQDRADMLRSIQKDTGGTHLIREDGQVTARKSSNDSFYSSFYKANGKPPTKADWLDEAHRQLTRMTDEQAQHYQQASKIAEAAHQAYLEKAATFKHSDIYAPTVTPEQAAKAKADLPVAEAKAGAERIDGQQPAAVVQPKPAETATTLVTRLKSIDEGKSNASKLKTLNDLIQHPDISNEDKAKFVAQRDMLRPSSKRAPQSEMTQPKSTRPNVNKTDQSVNKSEPNVNKMETAPASTSTDGAVGSESDVRAPGGGRIERVYDKLVGGRGSGSLNPSRAASRAGNVGLARKAADLVSSKRTVTYKARLVRNEFDRLAKGLNKDEINAALEGKPAANDKVAAAAAFFRVHADAIGRESVDAGVLKGQKDNYLPHVARGLDSRTGGNLVNKLKKTTRYNIERQTIEHLDEHGNIVRQDKYKTLNDFEAAIKKIDPNATAERDTSKLLEHLLTTEGHAIENAKTVEALKNTRMTDGRAAVISPTTENLTSQKFKDFKLVDNKLIHPDALEVYDAISRTGRIDNPFLNGLSRANSFGKRLVTLLGTIHAKNIAISGMAAHGIVRTIGASFGKGPSSEDIIRALSYGLKLSRASNDTIFDEVGEQTGLLGKANKIMKPADELLFHKFGDRQGMTTYKYLEKRLLKKGFAPDEAGRIAAEFGNQTMHFVSDDQMSIASRQASQLFFFAGQFLRNIAKTAANPLGIGIDRTLSKAAQNETQKIAIERVARLFAYSFVSAQAINLAVTGKYTWQNGNGDYLNPVWWQTKDKNGIVKQYRITNHYGQLKDVFGFVTNPFGETENKLAPGFKELAAQVTNHDAFTGDQIANSSGGELNQIWDRMVHAASNIVTPAGVNFASPSKQPGVVQAARYVGLNSSSAKPNQKLDFNKLATDKAAAQKLINAYTSGDQSKLAAMQALKAAGNSYFDKFFQENPGLDPTSPNFQGWTPNDSKQVNANIAAGFDTAKKQGNTLSYMQAIKLSGNAYFDKFFTAHPNLDPTSQDFTGTKADTAAAKRARNEVKYQAKAAKYAGEKFTKAKAPVKTTTKGLRRPSVKSLAGPKLKYTAPKKTKVVGGSLIKRSKKSITGI